MCTTCSKRAHKSEFGLGSTLRNFLSTKTEFSVLWTRLWPSFTLCPLRIRPWSLNEFCSWYVGVQLSFWFLSLTINGLGVNGGRKLAVSRSWLAESTATVPTVSEHHRRVYAARRRSPDRAVHAPRPSWHRWPCLKPPRACQTHSPIHFSLPLSPSFVSAAAAAVPSSSAVA